jgi:hypothetical protein
MVLEPARAQNAGGFGVSDACAVGMKFDIVADAAAKGAGRVFGYCQFHVAASL